MACSTISESAKDRGHILTKASVGLTSTLWQAAFSGSPDGEPGARCSLAMSRYMPSCNGSSLMTFEHAAVMPFPAYNVAVPALPLRCLKL